MGSRRKKKKLRVSDLKFFSGLRGFEEDFKLSAISEQDFSNFGEHVEICCEQDFSDFGENLELW